jgi:hypothetical protein
MEHKLQNVVSKKKNKEYVEISSERQFTGIIVAHAVCDYKIEIVGILQV